MRVVMPVHFHSGGIHVHGGVIGLPVKGRAGDVPASGQSPRLVMTIIYYCCCYCYVYYHDVHHYH
jgi:hypothetical protein